MAVINTQELRATIFKYYNSKAEFSRALGWNKYKVYKMLSGDYKPDVEEVANIVEKLNLSEKELISIFYPIFMPKETPIGDEATLN